MGRKGSGACTGQVGGATNKVRMLSAIVPWERFPLGRSASAPVRVVEVVVGSDTTTSTTTTTTTSTTTSTAEWFPATLEVAAERWILAGVPLPSEESAARQDVGDGGQHQHAGDDGDEDDPPRYVHRHDRWTHLRERLGTHGQLADRCRRFVQPFDRVPGVRADPDDVHVRIVSHERGIPQPGRDGDEGVRLRAEVVDLAHDAYAFGRLAGAVHLHRTITGRRSQDHRPVAPYTLRPVRGHGGRLLLCVVRRTSRKPERVHERIATDHYRTTVPFLYRQYVARTAALARDAVRGHFQRRERIQIEQPLALRLVVSHLQRPIDHQPHNTCSGVALPLMLNLAMRLMIRLRVVRVREPVSRDVVFTNTTSFTLCVNPYSSSDRASKRRDSWTSPLRLSGLPMLQSTTVPL
uniref:Uncharacterized protein n=1 Tax=Anopheles farauti TaxID=69004 RepID=A0A182QKZ6_9DIPT